MNKDAKLLVEAYESITEAKKDSKTEKGKDIHIITALKAGVKNCKNPSEKKNLMAKLMKYTEKLSNESVAGIEEDNDGVADSQVCPNCGQLTPKVS